MPSVDDVHPIAGAFAAAGEQDLGPLAWVLDELRKSLESAVKTMRIFVRDAAVARESDLASLDAGPLRIARQQLHQGAGALEMIAQAQPALLLRAMETAVQHYVQRPEQCGDAAVVALERAGFALVEYLENVLAGKHVSAVALFPQYRDVQALMGAGRAHPADLWDAPRALQTPALKISAAALAYSQPTRERLDRAVLRLVRRSDVDAAAQVSEICLGLAGTQRDAALRDFWVLCAAFFEALAHGLIAPDAYAKRAASRVLLQYAALARAAGALDQRLVRELLFFCAQARVDAASSADTPTLAALRQAQGFAAAEPVDYERPRFGLFDPAALVQARKRIAAATEIWSALAGGDRNKLKSASDQFSLVCDSLRKLHPDSEHLAQALSGAVAATLRSGEPPSAALGMEVATAVLYLQASFEELDAARGYMAERGAHLAERLDGVLAGGASQPLEPWMEELYRRVSDHQTMGSVVGELRAALAEAEKCMDQYFRDPSDAQSLAGVPGNLQQMRGVLSVLGLDQAAHAVQHMREVVERLLSGEIDEDARAALFDKLGNNLGALGFLIDMLSYQRAMARRLFVYDEELQELRLLMGRAGAQPEAGQQALLELPLELQSQPQPLEPPPQAAVASAPAPLPVAAPVARAPEEDAELLEIFLEEAREVVSMGLAAIEVLHTEPGDLSEQTTLRRAFHTLKGSSRMVGLEEFGEAAWALEQVLNAWLAEQKPVPAPMLQLSHDALQAFARWADDIAAGSAEQWSAQAFRDSADAMRSAGVLRALQLPGAAQEPQQETAEHAEASDSLPPAEFADTAVDLPPGFADTQSSGLLEELPASQSDQAPLLELKGALEVEDALPELNFSDIGRAPDEQAPAAVQPAEEISFDSFLAELNPEAAIELAAAAEPEAVAEPEAAAEAEAAAEPEPEPEPEPEAAIEPESDPDLEFETERAPLDFDSDFESEQAPLEPGSDYETERAPLEPDAEAGQDIAGGADDAVKVIGDLRIGIALYTVFLNEADEWSRQLVTTLQEWSLELHKPLPEAVTALAHSLGGSSATVGFAALSQLARAIEYASEHLRPLRPGDAEHAQVLLDAAEEVRRLLHQFAAGFLKEPQPRLLARLHELQQLALPVEGDTVAAPVQPLADAASLVEPAPPAPATPPMPATALIAPALIPVVVPTAAPAPAERVLALDDEFDQVDSADADLFPIFEEEASELLPALSAALRQWSERPENLGARSELLRLLHTLKGSARLAGAMRLGEMAHRLESVVEVLGTECSSADIEPLLARLDVMQAGFDALCAAAAAGASGTEPALQEAGPAPLHAAQPPLVSAPAPSRDAAAPMVEVASAQHLPFVPLSSRAGQMVRVRSQLLDRLVNDVGEVMIARSRLNAHVGSLHGSLRDLTQNLERLRQQLRDVELQAESQMQSRLQLSKDAGAAFDPLEFDRFTRVQELTRMMAESVNDVATVQRTMQRVMDSAEDDLVAQGRQARELQRDLLRTRMVEFDAIAERLYAVVRQSAKESGKQITLDIAGGGIELDRGVLERMTPAFEHLLRNCVVHGVEAPEVRAAAGKRAAGAITIALSHERNDVAIDFRDDGAGLNLERIREHALEQGLISADAQVDVQEGARLIFTPGFSTATQLTDIAGRGIGMDVVRAEVNALGGRIETSSQPGEGTTFRMVLPLTTAVTQVVLMRAAGVVFGVPAHLIEVVRRTPRADLLAAYASGELLEAGSALPFYWAGSLLQSGDQSGETAGKTSPVVVLRSASQRLALHVDEVLGSQEVVVKNLGPQLARLPGLSGMSVLASGAVVLIYNLVALATVYGGQARARMRQPTSAEAASAGAPIAPAQQAPDTGADAGVQVPQVLVVDDSITVRRVTQRLLQREGYRVALANDGLQALEQLQRERPTLVLSDIEMPRMDGFDLLRRIRADAQLADLPVVMITSRMAQKHRDLATELGANHYLGKPYADDELLALVQHYAQAQAEA